MFKDISERERTVIFMEENIAQRRQRRRKPKPSPVLPVLCAVAVVALVIVLVVVLANVNTGPLSLSLKGGESMTLEFGEKFADPGFTAAYGDDDVADAVQIIGTVDEGKLGTYTLTYALTYKDETLTVSRTVKIVDTTPPTIVLIHNENTLTLPGHEYEEEGFAAEDNYDGDLTSQVQRRKEGDEIVYQVFDSSGNRTEVRRTIKYGINVEPELTLLGNAVLKITTATSFESLQDPGFMAFDGAGVDITAKVQRTCDYDGKTPGEYTITYTVTDDYGNTATATRKLVVNKPEPNGNVIYLTFDDGPTSHTLRLLDILAKYDVKVTFFVVGSMDMSVLKKIAADGHSIALHSNTHDYASIYASEEAFFNDLETLRQKVYDACGVDTMLMRFPGGSSNTISKNYCKGIMTTLTKAVEERGYTYFDWNVSSGDAGGADTADEVYNNVISGIKGKKASVVLQHDIHGFSVDAVERIIQWGLANGYTFAPLSSTSPTAHHPVNN